jgi:hypothetical protein
MLLLLAFEINNMSPVHRQQQMQMRAKRIPSKCPLRVSLLTKCQQKVPKEHQKCRRVPNDCGQTERPAKDDQTEISGYFVFIFKMSEQLGGCSLKILF